MKSKLTVGARSLFHIVCDPRCFDDVINAAVKKHALEFKAIAS